MTRVMQVGVDGAAGWKSDRLTAEEPLELRLNGTAMSVTMRTPGDDFDLAVGFLVTEGIITGTDEIASMRACPSAAAPSGALNVVDVTLRGQGSVAPATRNFFMTSSCGVCGKASIEAVRIRSPHGVRDDPLRVSPRVLASLPDTLRSAQRAFARTGGLHAAGLFDAGGAMLCVREDVGRHNAFDKVIGWAATERRLPLTSCIILASGRASFELTQKALMAGIPCLAAVSAPSDLAVELARDAGMTLIGFLRSEHMNVYTGQHRVLAGGAPDTLTT